MWGGAPVAGLDSCQKFKLKADLHWVENPRHPNPNPPWAPEDSVYFHQDQPWPNAVDDENFHRFNQMDRGCRLSAG